MKKARFSHSSKRTHSSHMFTFTRWEHYLSLRMLTLFHHHIFTLCIWKPLEFIILVLDVTDFMGCRTLNPQIFLHPEMIGLRTINTTRECFSESFSSDGYSLENHLHPEWFHFKSIKAMSKWAIWTNGSINLKNNKIDNILAQF